MAGEERGPAKGHAYGTASITNVMKGIDFPKSKQDLIEEYGDEQIYWTKNNPQRLGNLLEKVSQNEFHSMADLTAAVGKVVSGGVKGRTQPGGEAEIGGKTHGWGGES